MATDLRLAGIGYNEHLRDIFMGFFDKRIAKLRGDRTLGSVVKATPKAFGHEAADVAVVQRPPRTDISSSEPDGKTPVNAETEPSCGNAKVEHISMCKDQREAAYKIGELNPDGFTVRDAAALIHAAGLSKGKIKTVMSNIYTLAARDDGWRKLAPGQFRLLPDIRPVDGGIFDQLRQEIADDDGEENELVQVA